MRQRKIVSLIGALAVVLSAVLMMTGCPQVPDTKPEKPGNAVKPGNAGTLKKGIIEFDATEVMCKKVIFSPYYIVTDINNGDQIQENDKLKFVSLISSEDQVVENWYINDVKQEYSTGLIMDYTVKATDFVDGKMKVSFATRLAVKGTVEFDTTVTCKKWISSTFTDINNGDQILENNLLQFEAVISSPDRVLEYWYINGVKQESGLGLTMQHHVKTTDFDTDGKMKVSFTTRPIAKGIVEFDEKVKCKKNGTDINTGDQIQENDGLKFEAILGEGKVFENWYINGVKQEAETNLTMSRRLKATDFVAGKMKVSFSTK